MCRRLDRTAEEVATTGDLGRRIDVAGSDEVARLAHTFNEMLSAPEASQESQRRLAELNHQIGCFVGPSFRDHHQQLEQLILDASG